MALKKCNDCGNVVSTEAESCPKCGAVLKKKIGCLGQTGVVVLILFIFLLMQPKSKNLEDTIVDSYKSTIEGIAKAYHDYREAVKDEREAD